MRIISTKCVLWTYYPRNPVDHTDSTNKRINQTNKNINKRWKKGKHTHSRQKTKPNSLIVSANNTMEQRNTQVLFIDNTINQLFYLFIYLFIFFWGGGFIDWLDPQTMLSGPWRKKKKKIGQRFCCYWWERTHYNVATFIPPFFQSIDTVRARIRSVAVAAQ